LFEVHAGSSRVDEDSVLHRTIVHGEGGSLYGSALLCTVLLLLVCLSVSLPQAFAAESPRIHSATSALPVTVERRTNFGELRSALLFQNTWEKHYGYLFVATVFIVIETLLVVLMLVELSRRRRAEQALSLSEFRMRELVQRAPYGITRATWNEDRFVSANPAAVKMLGYATEEELCSKSLSGDIYVNQSDRQKFLDQLRPYGEYSGKELHWRRKDGKAITVRASGRVVENPTSRGDYIIEGMIEDVTEQALLQQELRQAQKMEAVGRLAGGIAHDFNNLLGVILGYSELLEKTLPERPEMRERVRHISQAARHAATLTAQLLAFSRRQVTKPRVLNLNSVVRDAEKLLHRLIGEDVDLRIESDPSVGDVKADHAQLLQVIMNLAVNARDAMPKGGVLKIATRAATSNPAASDGNNGQHFAVLSVSDTGSGMTPEIRAHIFEPFFTTKGVDQGTGLGLATVHGIIAQAGGHIEVTTEVGKGTTFEIYLPCAEGMEATQIATAGRTENIVGGSETILIVEDSPQLLELMCECLQGLGYKLLTAANGEQALAILWQDSAAIDLMITDVVMPRMSGTELYERVQQIHPGLKVVFISGYLEDTLSRLKIQNAEITLIEKPFQVSDFTRTIREVLDDAKQAKQRA